MKIIRTDGRDDLAVVYLAELTNSRCVEFVESLQPPFSREKKWVLIISTLYGCPVSCLICDAGLQYSGRISKEDMFRQIDFPVLRRFPDRNILTEKFKIQFARMGEPAFNHAVLDVLEEFDKHYKAPGFIPSVSTIAPSGAEGFFDRLISVKNTKYSKGKFQFQFSIHSSDEKTRNKIMPVKKMSFIEMAAYGEKFYREGDNKITLNFCLINGVPVEPEKIKNYFDPEKFLIKITPLNPTYKSVQNGFSPADFGIGSKSPETLKNTFNEAGYEVIISRGETEENQIGSNCGQYVLTHLRNSNSHPEGYRSVAVKDA